jgi:redox-sensitive bicupin YhaK (pirin superfamily)
MSEIEQMIDGKPRDIGGFAVRRVLPALRRRTVGPFVFLDHMGPEDHQVAVRPHPHIHLATVTYLFEGEIHHRDSLGSHQVIRPGEINWMTAGRGIVHSERGDRVGRTHGLQLWVGLPRADEERAPSFEHYPVLPEFTEAGVRVRVLGGTAYGVTSPVVTASPLFYADVELAADRRIGLPIGHAERGVYVVSGAITAGTERIEPGRMAVFARDATTDLIADGPTRFVVLGGDPLDGPRYMWWNFISSDRQRVIDAAHAWRAGEFPKVPGDEVEFVPAPPEDPRFAQDRV